MPPPPIIPPQRVRRVDLFPQYQACHAEIHQAIDRVLNSGRYTLAEEVTRFEQAFACYLDVPEFVAVGDGTRAITMVLQHLAIGLGDDVVTVPFTAFPTVAAILDTGAKPVFADIDSETYMITADKMAEALTDRTRAIIPVHIFGNVVDIPALQARLSQLGRDDVVIIEDAAQAHGSCLRGVKAGSQADFATFSFYPTKNLGGYGDGGGIACAHSETAAALRRARNYGFVDKDVIEVAGINSRLDELQAAILSAKLTSLDDMNARRHELVAHYIEALPSLGFTPQAIPADVDTNWHVFEPRYEGDRDALVSALQTDGIQTNVYYVVPHHLQPALSSLGYHAGDLPNAEKVCKTAIALPLYPELPASDVRYVIDRISHHVK